MSNPAIAKGVGVQSILHTSFSLVGSVVFSLAFALLRSARMSFSLSVILVNVNGYFRIIITHIFVASKKDLQFVKSIALGLDVLAINRDGRFDNEFCHNVLVLKDVIGKFVGGFLNKIPPCAESVQHDVVRIKPIRVGLRVKFNVEFSDKFVSLLRQFNDCILDFFRCHNAFVLRFVLASGKEVSPDRP